MAEIHHPRRSKIVSKEAEGHPQDSQRMPAWTIALTTIAAAGVGLTTAAALGAAPVAIVGTLGYLTYRAMTAKERRERAAH
jgi:hypothetical protein